MVAWIHCPACNKVVDEFESRCYWCHSDKAILKLKEKVEYETDRCSRERVCGDGSSRGNETCL